MKSSPFFKQAELMLRAVPHVAAERCFALKGGTAINLFVRDLPRLSVDMDLAYLPIELRDTSLKNIGASLKRIAIAIRKANPDVRIQESYALGSKHATKLVVHTSGAQIKIEPNLVIRGAVFPCTDRELVRQAEELFERSASIQTLSMADLYDGKLCAALDRQHPRDLFDVKILMDHEGITDEIRKAFVVYLASHDRPMHALLDPARKDIRQVYENEFAGMARVPVPYQELIAVREKLIAILKNELKEQEKQFLLSLKEGQPKWDYLGIEGIEKLPAIQWKVMNIRKMDKRKHAEALEKLKAKLGL